MASTDATVGTETTLGAWLRAATVRLRDVSESPRTDAELILGAVLAWPRTRVVACADALLAAEQQDRAGALLVRRSAGEPMAYLLGTREFWSLTLAVTAAVLVPRPETEGVVERGLALLQGVARPRVLDLGTGSGAIALALAHARPDAEVVATDVSVAALAVARGNAQRLGLHVGFVAGNWYAPLAAGRRFDLIVSNPPYIDRRDPALQPAVARHEPALALYAGDAGFAALATIVKGAARFLSHGGSVVLEHGATQGRAVCDALGRAGFAEIRDACDLAGLPRVASARRASQEGTP